jgi:hypothetical protein
MIYDTELNGGYPFLKFDIATDDARVYDFNSLHCNDLPTFLQQIKHERISDTNLIVLLGIFHNIQESNYFFQHLNDFYHSVPNPVIVFNGCLTAQRCDVVPDFPYHRLNIFDHYSNLYIKHFVSEEIAPPPNEKKHKFYWASTKDWYTRRYLLAKLMQHNLLDGNLVNYKCLHTNIPSDFLECRFAKIHHSEIVNTCNSIADQIPLPALDNTDYFIHTPINFYTNSYFGIITDTFYEHGIFLSEKVFNAINYYQMFAYLGPHHTLRYLREQGYQTFGHVIDESYDEIEDNALRLFEYCRSVTEFLSQPIDKIHEAHVKCISQLEHNKRLLSQQRPDLAFTEFTRQALIR